MATTVGLAVEKKKGKGGRPPKNPEKTVEETEKDETVKEESEEEK